MKRERWVPCISGWYEVSDRGRVRRVRPRYDSKHPERFTPTLITPTQTGEGWKSGTAYLSFLPSIFGEQRVRVYVHQLVAAAFLGPRPLGKEINHKDGVRGNNKVTNLEYVSRLENVQHAHRVLRRMGGRKLTDRQVRAVRAAKGKAAARVLAKRFTVSTSTIRSIWNGRTGYLIGD